MFSTSKSHMSPFKKHKDASTQTIEPRIEAEEVPPLKRKKIEAEYTHDELHYYKSLPKSLQTSIIQIEKRVRSINTCHIPLRFKIILSKMQDTLKAHSVYKLTSLNDMDPSSGEYHKLLHYIESVARIPLGIYKDIACTKKQSSSEICEFLNGVKSKLDTTVFGHDETKNQIIKLLAQWISNPDSAGLVLGIEGDMGVGKTTLVKNGICNALGLPFGFIPLGGASDGSHLIGHSYTYEGSRWGRIVDILMNCGCMNPILYFDELDKVSDTRYGHEIINILIHLTDATQNTSFHDKYFSELELDLSKCLIIFSYNNVENINPILKDRMVTIKTNGYKMSDKINIVCNYMYKELCDKYSYQDGDIVLSNDILTYIIQKTEDENGVRNLKRSLDSIFSHINLCKIMCRDIYMTNTDASITFPFTVDKKHVDHILKRTERKDSAIINTIYI